MKSQFWTLLLVLSVFGSGCGIKRGSSAKDEPANDSYERRTDNYEELRNQIEVLRKKYNAHLGTSYQLEQAVKEEALLLVQMDFSLTTFASEVELAKLQMALKPLAQKDLEKVETARAELLGLIAQVEASTLKQWDALNDNAAHVYEKPDKVKLSLAALRGLMKAKNDQMTGLRQLIEVQIKSLVMENELRAKIANTPVVPLTLGTKPIEIKPEEKVFAGASSSTVVVRGSGNTVSTLSTSAQVEDYAYKNGFNKEAARDAYQMSSKTGGLTTFANDPKALSQSVVDLLAHIKAGMNGNIDDLELAFIIDYSGSMADDIEGVIKGLVEITNSLEAVRKSGRKVKLAIVTFGKPTKEAIELPFTENLVLVKENLTRLRAEFASKNHYVEPGEASYHGLKLALQSLAWSSRNRRAIVITDEPSHELAEPAYGQKFVDGVVALAKNRAVETAIYTIVVK